MSIISIPYTFSPGTTIVSSQVNSCFSTIYSDYNGNIGDTNLSSSIVITDTKLAQITDAAKVAGTALTTLNTIPSGAGVIPVANIPVGTSVGNVVQLVTGGTSLAVVPAANMNPVWFSTQHVVTGSRSIGSPYQNITGKTMMVTVTLTSSNSGVIYIYTDSSSSPSTIVAGQLISSSYQVPITFMVLPNNYYEVYQLSGTQTIEYWTEWY